MIQYNSLILVINPGCFWISPSVSFSLTGFSPYHILLSFTIPHSVIDTSAHDASFTSFTEINFMAQTNQTVF